MLRRRLQSLLEQSNQKPVLSRYSAHCEGVHCRERTATMICNNEAISLPHTPPCLPSFPGASLVMT